MELDLKAVSAIVGSITAVVVAIISLYKNGKLSKEIERIKSDSSKELEEIKKNNVLEIEKFKVESEKELVILKYELERGLPEPKDTNSISELEELIVEVRLGAKDAQDIKDFMFTIYQSSGESHQAEYAIDQFYEYYSVIKGRFDSIKQTLPASLIKPFENIINTTLTTLEFLKVALINQNWVSGLNKDQREQVMKARQKITESQLSLKNYLYEAIRGDLK